MADAETLKVYAERAGDYARLFDAKEPDADLGAFIAELPAGARVLDLGCGPGHAAALMRAAGLQPDATDACREMVDLANQLYDLDARLASFDDLAAIDAYDGVWANFSLLHAPRTDLPRNFAAISRALRAGGVLHLGMKLGQGEARDGLGRSYTYVTEAELREFVTMAGLTPIAQREGAEKGLAGTNDPFIILRARKTTDA
jgi:SAM-dependent methyltransferase